MQSLKWILVRVLLTKTFVKMLAKQLYVKLTKFTRRSKGIQEWFHKVERGYDFVKQMVKYDSDVIRLSKFCLHKLAAENIQEVSVYGERDVAEVLYDLTFEIPVRIRAMYAENGNRRGVGMNVVPVEMSVGSGEKVIIASLVNTEAKEERLRRLGIERERIVLL